MVYFLFNINIQFRSNLYKNTNVVLYDWAFLPTFWGLLACTQFLSFFLKSGSL